MNRCRSAPATGGSGRSFTASARSRKRWSIALTSRSSAASAISPPGAVASSGSASLVALAKARALRQRPAKPPLPRATVGNAAVAALTLPKHPRDQNPVAPRQVATDEHLVEPGRGRHLARSLRLMRRDLAHEGARRLEPHGRLARELLDRLRA